MSENALNDSVVYSPFAGRKFKPSGFACPSVARKYAEGSRYAGNGVIHRN